MKEINIIEALFSFNLEKGHQYMSSNTQSIPSVGEADFVSVNKNNFVTEFEIKTSRSDYKADFKKTGKHDLMKGVGRRSDYFDRDLRKTVWSNKPFVNYFYYVVPKDLINIDEVPEYAGLIYVTRYEMEGGGYSYICDEIKKPKRFHKNKCEDSFIMRMLRSVMFKYYNNIHKL